MLFHTKTPCILSERLSDHLKKPVYLKLETHQPTRCFKIRGIGNACIQAVANGATHLIASSGGNSGLAVAYCGAYLKVPVTVIIPETTLPHMKELIRKYGATVIVKGNCWDQAHEYAKALSKIKGMAYIPPFDHPDIWQGHASIIKEIADDNKKPDLFIAAVGGGGLLAGILLGLDEVSWSEIPVMAVEPKGAASFLKSYQHKKQIELEQTQTIATSLATKSVCKKVIQLSQNHNIIAKTVSDKKAVKACLNFYEDHHLLVEPACGSALAMVYGKVPECMDAKSICVIVCGGLVVTPKKLKDWAHQFNLYLKRCHMDLSWDVGQL